MLLKNILKIGIGLIAALVVGLGIGLGISLGNTGTEKEIEVSLVEEMEEAIEKVEEVEEEIEEEIEEIEEEIDEDLTDLISEYENIVRTYCNYFDGGVTGYNSGETLEYLKGDFAKYDTENMRGFEAVAWPDVHYGLCDLNNDGLPELIVADSAPDNISGKYDDYAIQAVWSVKDGEVYFLADRSWGQIFLEENGYVSVHFESMEFDDAAIVEFINEDGYYERAILDHTYKVDLFDFTEIQWTKFEY